MEVQQLGSIEEIEEFDEQLQVTEFSKQVRLAKVLGSETRLKIIKLLRKRRNDPEGGLDITTLAYLLDQTEANISAQCKKLEKAELINITYKPGGHGVRKICQVDFKSIEFILD